MTADDSDHHAGIGMSGLTRRGSAANEEFLRVFFVLVRDNAESEGTMAAFLRGLRLTPQAYAA